MRTEELALAQRCAAGEAQALEAFERDYLAPAAAFLAKKYGAERAQDALQRGRVRLLVGDGGRPLLEGFRGEGPLAGWLRVVLTRIALEVVASGQPRALDDADLPRRDPELLALTERYGPTLEACFKEALGELEHRERVALKLSTLDGLSLEKIGAVFQVNASSVSRWLSSARAKLREETVARLQARLDLSPGSAEGLIGELQGQWDVSLRRALGSGP